VPLQVVVAPRIRNDPQFTVPLTPAGTYGKHPELVSGFFCALAAVEIKSKVAAMINIQQVLVSCFDFFIVC
jgi:hypothetical protein